MKPKKQAGETVKKAVQKIIANTSIIAIIAAVFVIALSYAGLTFELSFKLVINIFIPSVILAISAIIVYELWIRNGIENARNEEDYKILLAEYDRRSTNLDLATMQKYIDYEKKRRYDVEYSRLSNSIEKLESSIEKLKELKLNAFDKVKLKTKKHNLKKLIKARENIYIDMPYYSSEQFDQLRYHTSVTTVKEYKPNDTSKFMRKHRFEKYAKILTTTLVGLNSFTATIGGKNWGIAVFMTLLAILALFGAVVSGFTTGYNSVAISSTGVYKTAINYIVKAKAYCLANNLELYLPITDTEENYVDPNLTKVENIKTPEEVKTDNHLAAKTADDYFNNLLK